MHASLALVQLIYHYHEEILTGGRPSSCKKNRETPEILRGAK